jgi:cation diffusion facilitator CzcD-associated flavoprotein CzcO
MIRDAARCNVAGMTTTHTGTPDCQVLVVGAGPTGLTLAAQLLARGIHARVIDKGEGLAPQNRAVAYPRQNA